MNIQRQKTQLVEKKRKKKHSKRDSIAEYLKQKKPVNWKIKW